MKIVHLGVLILFAWCINGAHAQKYFTREGKIRFFSKAPLENIEANNKTVASVLDAATGRLEFAVLIKGFQFEKAKMQEDFNDNFMDSSKYPKAQFKGLIENWEQVDLSRQQTYELDVSGDLTIHGVTQPLKTTAELTVRADQLKAHSSFMIAVADFGIKIPTLVTDKIASEVEVTVNIDYQPLKK